MDIFDQATEREEKDRAESLKHFRKAEPIHSQKCRYCLDADSAPGSAFCSAECLADWEREQAAKSRNGR